MIPKYCFQKEFILGSLYDDDDDDNNNNNNNNSILIKGKGKATLLQAWRGPEGCRNLRLPDFKTIGTRKW
jgi:hypothetical protein